MTQEEEIAYLRADNQRLQEQLAQALTRIEELEKQKTPPPSFVKANVAKPKEKKVRKKRRPDQNGVRKRANPTQVVEHRIDTCPTCQGRLSTSVLARRRQVIELAPPPAVEVTEHHVYKGWCSFCRAWKQASLDVGEQVLGQGRLSSRIASLIAYLRSALRMPVRHIQSYLACLHELKVSVGEIVEVLHRIEAATRQQVQTIKQDARSRPVLHADETGWREDGHNGYIWSLSTQQGERYFEYHHSRAGAVATSLVGEEFHGVLVSDFYGGYNDLACSHQRCWVHLLRDLHEMKDLWPHDDAIQRWIQEIDALYRIGMSQQGTGQETYQALVSQAKELAARYASVKKHPCQALCKRLLRHQDELFQFVLKPNVVAENNLAERSIRPLVVARKISGGSRSPKGSTTRMALASLFGTWQAKGLNVLEQCQLSLSHPSPLPQP
jgi:transposase